MLSFITYLLLSWSGEALPAYEYVIALIVAAIAYCSLGRNKKSRRYGTDGLSPKRWGLFVCYFFGPFLWALVKANIDVALRIITGRVKPGIVKVNPTGIGGKTMAITDESEFYSGCYGWADVGFFAFNQGVNSGISVGLNNLLKTGGEDGQGNGQYMGGRSSAESVFGAEIEADDMPADDNDLS